MAKAIIEEYKNNQQMLNIGKPFSRYELQNKEKLQKKIPRYHLYTSITLLHPMFVSTYLSSFHPPWEREREEEK